MRILIFTPRETVGGFNHMRMRIQRSLLNQPVNRFIDEFGGEPVISETGEIKCCWQCGFALAQVQLANGWRLQTCSATGLKGVMRNKQLDEWSNTLPQSVSSVQAAFGAPPVAAAVPANSRPSISEKV